MQRMYLAHLVVVVYVSIARLLCGTRAHVAVAIQPTRRNLSACTLAFLQQQAMNERAVNSMRATMQAHRQ